MANKNNFEQRGTLLPIGEAVDIISNFLGAKAGEVEEALKKYTIYDKDKSPYIFEGATSLYVDYSPDLYNSLLIKPETGHFYYNIELSEFRRKTTEGKWLEGKKILITSVNPKRLFPKRPLNRDGFLITKAI